MIELEPVGKNFCDIIKPCLPTLMLCIENIVNRSFQCAPCLNTSLCKDAGFCTVVGFVDLSFKGH